jgi:hypothetical protein
VSAIVRLFIVLACLLAAGIVNDIFRWTRELDPGAQLVFNE